jgi:NAD(P)-dependent dehydrogenase (short-subunit alcohol dehydrogenase family)
MVEPAPRLTGEVAVVTGAGRGLGEAYARRLLAEGATVAVTDVDLEAAGAVADDLGAGATAFELDVASWDSVRGAAGRIHDTLGPVTALVNNAGVSRVARAEELPEEWWHQVVEVNVNGTWRCCQVFGGGMVQRGRGAIVNIGSAYTEIGAAGRVAYATSKTAVLGMTRVLGVEWAPFGVRVNLVEPGYIDTPMMQVTLTTGSSQQLVDRIPAGRLGGADEVARAIAFLLSSDASYVTGATLRIDGGHLSYGGIPPATVRPAPLDR